MPASTSSIRAGKAFVELFADDSKLVRGLKRAQSTVESWGKSVQSIGKKVFAAGSAILAPLITSAGLFAKIGGDLHAMSQRTGIAVESLSTLGFAAAQSSADLETLETGIKNMQQLLSDAADGNEAAIATLNKLGLTLAQLADMAPDEQFRLFAARLSQVAPAARRTAVAIDVFGRSGAQLLPMISNGVDGLKKLEDQAREFGLVISGDTARAADEMQSALSLAWQVVKKTAVIIGSTLAPVITEYTNRIAKLAAKINAWIDTNRALIMVVAQIGIAVAAAGAVLFGLGTALMTIALPISIISTAMLGMNGLLKVAVGVFSGVLSVIGTLLSPMGMLGTLLVALAGYAIYSSATIRAQFESLGRVFTDLWVVAKETFDGIVLALQTGDYQTAAQILWAGLKLEWAKGTAALNQMWLDSKKFFVDVWASATNGIASAFVNLSAGLATAFIKSAGQMRKVFYALIDGMVQIAAKPFQALAYAGHYASARARLNSHEDAKKIAEAESAKLVPASVDNPLAKGARRLGDIVLTDAIEAKRKEALAELKADLQRHYGRGAATADMSAVKAAQDELDALKKRAAVNAANATKPRGFDSAAGGANGALDVAGSAKTSVAGTFNALAAGRTGGALDRLLPPLKSSNQYLASINRNTQNAGLAT